MYERVRLHISPLTPELLPKILPEATRKLATNICFQRLETFPERDYGFVDLPTMEAQKLKKKANGSIIKGVKVKVDEAREKRHTRRRSNEDAMEVDGAEDDINGDKPSRAAAKKRKREDGVLPGHELSEERKVKRGWTEPTAVKIKEKREKKKDKDKEGDTSMKNGPKKQQASQYSDEAECLFKTKVPLNKQDLVAEKGKDKKRKKGKESSEAVVHEFERNQKHPSFVKSSISKDKKPVAKYDETKGWMDVDGKMVELPQRTRSRRSAAKKPSVSPDAQTNTTTVERLGSLSLKEQEEGDENDEETSSSGESSVSQADSDDENDAVGSSSEASIPPRAPVNNKEKSASPPQPSITATVTHPLEALYKKPGTPASRNKANLSVDAVPFSFFGDAGADADDELSSTIRQGIKTSIGPGLGIGALATDGSDTGAAGDVSSTTLASPPSARPRRGPAANLPNLAIPPATPFTQRDQMWRAQRSAAPTPDTAMPNKTGFGNVWGSTRGRRGRHLGDEEGIEEEEEEEDENEEYMSENEKRITEILNRQKDKLDDLESGAQGDESSEGQSPEASEKDDEEDPADEAPAPRTRKAKVRREESTFVGDKFAHRGEINRTWKREAREENKAKRKAKNRRSNA